MSEIKTSQQESVQKNGRFSFKAAKWVWIGLSVPMQLRVARLWVTKAPCGLVSFGG